jgi:hypothetical protein
LTESGLENSNSSPQPHPANPAPVNPPSAQIKASSTVVTADPGATDAARRILSFLIQLQKNKQILLGQDLGAGSYIVSGLKTSM